MKINEAKKPKIPNQNTEFVHNKVYYFPQSGMYGLYSEYSDTITDLMDGENYHPDELDKSGLIHCPNAVIYPWGGK